MLVSLLGRSRLPLRLGGGIRSLSSSQESILNNKAANANYTPEEISIPMPWGNVAGQSWGSGQHTVLALHGYLDNCATFDRLFRLMPLDKMRLIAVDLPGHGKSDHIAPGMNYTMTDGLVALTRTQDYLGLSKCTIMGHSMGAAIAALFCATFPERATKLAMLDLLGIGPVPLKKHVKLTRKSVLAAIKYHDLLAKSRENPESVPKYEKLDAIARAFMANTLIHGADSITKESVTTLMTRGLQRVDTTKDGKDL